MAMNQHKQAHVTSNTTLKYNPKKKEEMTPYQLVVHQMANNQMERKNDWIQPSLEKSFNINRMEIDEVCPKHNKKL